MDKIWESTDKVLSGIGRFVLLRPGISGLLLLMIAFVTLWNNKVFSYSDDDVSLVFVEAERQAEVALSAEGDESTETPIKELPLPSSTTNTLLVAEAKPTPIPAPSLKSPEPSANSLKWKVFKVASGDTLLKIFQRHKIGVKDALAISKLKSAKLLTNLTLGNSMGLLINSDKSFNSLAYGINDKKTLTVKQLGKDFKVAQINKPVSLVMLELESAAKAVAFSSEKEIAPSGASILPTTVTSSPIQTPVMVAKTEQLPTPQSASAAKAKIDDHGLIYASGEIAHSLYTDARKAGLSVKQANQLGQIFSDKSVVKNLKKGDEFSVLYEKPSKTANGEKRTGNILLAQLTHKSEVYQAIRFTDPKGKTTYYNQEGKTSIPAISRAPLRYTRISSHFSKGRMHPLLHIVRPHTGVDYSAPSGTPIKAAGDGVIVYSAYKSGYGNMVTIEHDGKYSTLYAHLSRFAKNMKKGATVKEGEIIGYVGQTGTATGAHLHYEILVNNVPKDPLTVAIPGASIPKAYKKQFFAQVKTLLAQLKLNQAIKLAKNDGNSKPSASRG